MKLWFQRRVVVMDFMERTNMKNIIFSEEPLTGSAHRAVPTMLHLEYLLLQGPGDLTLLPFKQIFLIFFIFLPPFLVWVCFE